MTTKSHQGRAALLALARKLRFETHDIGSQLDSTGHYALPLHREFPLSVRLFHYRAGRFTQGVTWHEQLELFCPIAGRVDVQMGSQLIRLAAGDLLVMDNLKLHHVVDRPDLDARVMVVSFLPELVYSLGSLSHDFGFLLPFYAQLENRPHVLRAVEPAARVATHASAAWKCCCRRMSRRAWRQGRGEGQTNDRAPPARLTLPTGRAGVRGE